MERKGMLFICELKLRDYEKKIGTEEFKNLLSDCRELPMIYHLG